LGAKYKKRIGGKEMWVGEKTTGGRGWRGEVGGKRERKWENGREERR